MKKFLNNPENFVDEMVEDIIAAHPDQLTFVENDLRCIVKAGDKVKGKVGLATGGGSGRADRVGLPGLPAAKFIKVRPLIF